MNQDGSQGHIYESPEHSILSGMEMAVLPDDCTSSNTCCSFNNLSYFPKQLLGPTTDDIECRMCNDYSDYSAQIEFMEMYVQYIDCYCNSFCSFFRYM